MTAFQSQNSSDFAETINPSAKFGRREYNAALPMEVIDGWDNNPEIRTRPSSLTALSARINDVGQLVPISVVPYRDKRGLVRYRVVDGHRRKAILQQAGAKFVEAIIYLDVEVGTDQFGILFEVLNVGTRPPGIRERIWLALRGERAAAGLEACRIADEISGALSTLALEKFEDAGCPKQAFNNAKSAYRQLRERGLVGGERKAYREFLSSAVIWQLDLNEQQALKLYLTQVSAIAVEHLKKYGTTGASSKRLCRELLGYISGGLNIPKPKMGPAPRFQDEEDDVN
jgi:ParB-like nuclease domain